LQLLSCAAGPWWSTAAVGRLLLHPIVTRLSRLGEFRSGSRGGRAVALSGPGSPRRNGRLCGARAHDALALASSALPRRALGEDVSTSWSVTFALPRPRTIMRGAA